MSVDAIKKKLATVKPNDYVAVRGIPPVVLRDTLLIAAEALNEFRKCPFCLAEMDCSRALETIHNMLGLPKP